jgi:UDP-glucose 4-epimerase
MKRSLERVVILGGGGFLGGAVARQLHAGGADEVTVVERRHHGAAGGITADVLSADLVALLRAAAPDVVFHFATTSFVPPSLDDPYGDLVSNVGSTVRVLDAARRLPLPPLVVVASSAAVYGHGRAFPMAETHPCEPLSPYGAAKLAAEQYGELYHRIHGLEVLSVRPFSLFGPQLRKQVMFDLTSRVINERNVVADADPTVERDFVFVDDAASMIVRLAEAAPGRGEAYNICSGVATSIGELGDLICAELGVGTIVFSGRGRAGDPSCWRGDVTRAAQLGANATTPLREGLGATVRWIANRAR